ncbi:CD48 antigen-like [Genypterus blacodes]|uniref:CD48 antigen-like n=1 Tax=Genypterus blacodes TaxID=154954 RepID=UPI003F759588
MARAVRRCLTAALLVLLLEAAGAEQTDTQVIRLGGKLSMTPPLPEEMKPLFNMWWKHGRDLVCEWDKDGVEIYIKYKGRSQLDHLTARLEIDNMTTEDNGVYTLFLNNNEQPWKTVVTVVRDVTKPSIQISPLKCSYLSDSCILTCEGDVTEVGEVTFRWKEDGGAWERQGQKMDITKLHHSKVENFFCQMSNQISDRQSEGVLNPLYKAPLNVLGLVLGVLAVLVAAAVGVVVLWKKKLLCFASKKAGGAAERKADEEDDLKPKP